MADEKGEAAPSDVAESDATRIRGLRQTYVLGERISVRGALTESYRAVPEGSEEPRFVKTPHIPEDAIGFVAVRDRLGRIFNNIWAEFANYHNLEQLKCVARVYDVGLREGRDSWNSPVLYPFLVQQFVAGRNVRDSLKARPLAEGRFKLEVDEYMAAVRMIVSAVRRVHEKNVVHGDLHPGNFMVEQGEDGTEDWDTLKLVDFGQAFFAESSVSAPEPTKGRPEHTYRAPERRDRAEH